MILTDTLVKAGIEVAQTRTKKKLCISPEAKDLMNKRRTLLEQGKRTTTEYTEVNKAIRKNIKETKKRIQEENILKMLIEP